jgi:hypothetical protein
LFNSFEPSSRNAPDKFKGRKEEEEEEEEEEDRRIIIIIRT